MLFSADDKAVQKVVGVVKDPGIVPMSNAKMKSSGNQWERVEHIAPLPAEKPAVLVWVDIIHRGFAI